MHLLRTHKRPEEAIEFGCGNLYAYLEVTLNTRRCSRAELIFLKQGMSNRQDAFIALEILRRILCAVRFPHIVRTVYRLGRNVLTDNTLHDLEDHLLLLIARFFVGVECFELVTQIPVAEQDFIFRPEFATVLGAQVAHVDIVVGDIVLGIGVGLCQSGIYRSRYARGEHIAQTRHSPLLT